MFSANHDKNYSMDYRRHNVLVQNNYLRIGKSVIEGKIAETNVTFWGSLA